MSTTGTVTMTGVTKKYGDRTVLDGLDLQMTPGMLLALLGPSGCGKTTTLRILAGLESLDAGRVEVDGDDITGVPVRKRNMGIVFQAYSLFPHMSAQENVEYGMAVRKVNKPKREQRAAELLEMVGLIEHRGKYPSQMSGGQQQRVALARALAVEPRVLLLDEPLSALDAKVRVTLREEIRRIQLSAGITTLFVTHDQEEALTIADQVGVMKDGRLAQLDAPEKLYKYPNSVFISEFVGVVNRIPCTVEAGRTVVLGTPMAVTNADAPTGGAGDALVRPEDIVATPIAEGSARVVSQVVRGATTSVLVDQVNHDGPIRIDVSSPQAAHFPVGSAVELRVGRGDVVVSATSTSVETITERMAA